MPSSELSPLLHTHFARQAAATPDRLALHHHGTVARYGELADGAARLAGALLEAGLGPGRYVALHLERSIDSVLATLAILGAGAAVVPLPPSYPESRRREILDFAALDAVIDGAASPIGELYRGPVLRVGDSSGGSPVDLPPVSPDSPAFVLLSSGSTGEPKMIVRSHRSFFHRLRWTWTRLPFQPGERCCQKSHMTTTHAVYELFEPLLAGVPITVVDDAEVRDLEAFWATIRGDGVTRLLIVPSLLRASLDMPGFEAPPLRALTLMGEAVDGMLADDAVSTFAATPSIVSIYGSTESSSSLVSDLRSPRPPGEAPSLGLPLDDTVEAVVLDESLLPVEDDEPGMLYLAGPQLFTEYFRNPEETAAVLVECPDGRRRFRTADVVSRESEGSLRFVGRTGDVVKVRGFRVDLREVEAAVAAAPGVRLAAVAPVENALVGFVGPGTVATAEVRRWLDGRLPAQMVPSVLVPLDDFPRAANGKIDRRALAAAWSARGAGSEGVFATETERRIAEVWREVLGPAAIEPSTNFFEAGGTSLTVFAVVHRLRSIFDLSREELTDQSIYANPTVELLARRLDLPAGEGGLPATDASTQIGVSLRSGMDGALGAVFLIASAGGTLGSYDKLVERLTGPRPIVGIRDPFLWQQRDPSAGFDHWIDIYLRAIRERGHTDGYRIVAYSSAGAFGYEIARRLRQEGATVSRLVLVDPLGLDSSSSKSFGHWALRARWMPSPAGQALGAAGRLRSLVPQTLRRDGPSHARSRLDLSSFDRFADSVRQDRDHIRRLSVLFELQTGLPVSLSDEDFVGTLPEGYVDLLLERFRRSGSEIEPEMLDRIVVQYETQVRTQHAYPLRPYDGEVSIFVPAGPFARLTAVQLGPYVHGLEIRELPLGEPSAHVRELAAIFDPGIRDHYLCMRDDLFAGALAVELDRLLAG
jgi:acyl-coenzyme A synthetase/AMP-(fatty) acid ligase